MTRKIVVESRGLQRSEEIGRVIGRYGEACGPTVVVTAGLHGNEPAGIFALIDVIGELSRGGGPFRGELVGLAGNLEALSGSVRQIDMDLNRMWKREYLASHSSKGIREQEELEALYRQVQELIGAGRGPYFFVDLHTTSSQSPPFIPFDDTLLNRDFVEAFPVPGILGIEEFLPGTLLSYLTRYSVVAIGYEGGQHEDPRSVDYHRAFLWLVLEKAGCIRREDYPQVAESYAILKAGTEGLSGFFEVRYRHAIETETSFRMLPGFKSFQPIHRQQLLAEGERGPVVSPQTGRIFMPLYQAQGTDGFFVIRPVKRIWLQLSKWMRRWKLERWLAMLPGVQLSEDTTLSVDTRIARFLAVEFFHLLGYRRQVRDGTMVHFSRREH